MLKFYVSAILLLAVTAIDATAQAPGDRQVRPLVAAGRAVVAEVTKPADEAAQLDQAIATCLWLGNQEEIALAQFAEGHAKSEEVKTFVAMMVKDHRSALDKLQRAAPEVASWNLQLQTRQEGTAVAASAGAGSQSPMIAMQKRVAEECLSLTQKELGEHIGADFDRCFIGQQMGAHLATLAKLRGSKDFASGQLRPFIDEATKTVERHYAEAKKIAKSLESDASSEKQARRNEGDSRTQ